MARLTITEASKELGVSRPTVYKKIKNAVLNAVREDGRTYVLLDDMPLDADKLEKDIRAEAKNRGDTDTMVMEGMLIFLREQLREKDRQIADKSREISELHRLLAQSQQLVMQVPSEGMIGH
jgi:excisionase family DNA binding protein